MAPHLAHEHVVLYGHIHQLTSGHTDPAPTPLDLAGHDGVLWRGRGGVGVEEAATIPVRNIISVSMLF